MLALLCTVGWKRKNSVKDKWWLDHFQAFIPQKNLKTPMHNLMRFQTPVLCKRLESFEEKKETDWLG